MPRFHFHVEDGASYPDEEGVELPDLATAKAHAVRYFADMLKTSPCTFWDGDQLVMDVADETGLTLFSLHFVGIESPALYQLQVAQPEGPEACEAPLPQPPA
jgi:hypothetical protein